MESFGSIIEARRLKCHFTLTQRHLFIWRAAPRQRQASEAGLEHNLTLRSFCAKTWIMLLSLWLCIAAAAVVKLRHDVYLVFSDLGPSHTLRREDGTLQCCDDLWDQSRELYFQVFSQMRSYSNPVGRTSPSQGWGGFRRDEREQTRTN